jgi:hypothetical protein
MDFLKAVRTEQDRLENSSPTILAKVIKKFNLIFANRNIEKPEITGDLDEVNVNRSPTSNMLKHAYSFVKAPVDILTGKSKRVLPINPSSNDENVIVIQRSPAK